MNTKISRELIFRKEISNTYCDLANIDIGMLSPQDLQYYTESKKYSSIDVNRLREADYCIIARQEGHPVHHSCISTSQYFEHPRKELAIDICANGGYVYNVKTETEYRGQGIALEVLKYIDRFATTEGIERIYADVDAKNHASKKLFQKSGYTICGILDYIQYGSLSFVINRGTKFYYNSYRILPFNIHLSKYRSSRRRRIQSDISECASVWQEQNRSVVLFGAGNHAEEVLEVESVRFSVSYAVDESTDKIGTTLSGGEVPVRPLDAISENPPDIVVICSRAFQQEMVTRVKEYDKFPRILTLYPTVGYE